MLSALTVDALQVRAVEIDPRQADAPYLQALRAFASGGPRRFMVPGHTGGRATDPEWRLAVSPDALSIDVPLLIEGIDIATGGEQSPYELARRLAADAWGASRTWFLTNGASQGNLAACLAVAGLGSRVVVQRNVHSSTIDGLVLAGLEPTFVAPEIDLELGIAHCVTPDALDAALTATPGAAAAMVVSPTYFGAVADVRSLSQIAHAHGVPLIVDEAWGAHLAFSKLLPEHALAAGADLVVSSTHKHAGSLSQSAMLHLGPRLHLSEERIDRSLALVSSTSPSSLMRASLDASRRHAVLNGRALLANAIGDLAQLREQIERDCGLPVLDDRIVGRFGIAAIDPMRVCVDVRSTGATGYEVGRQLFDDGVHVELCSHSVVVALFGLHDDVAAHGEAFRDALERSCERLRRRPQAAALHRRRRPPQWGAAAMAPRAAYLAHSEQVPVSCAEGRIAAECLAAYPPGIPNVIPGERLTTEIIAHLVATVQDGGVVRGAADPTLQTLRVVREPAAAAWVHDNRAKKLRTAA